jgi:hypothetical protein
MVIGLITMEHYFISDQNTGNIVGSGVTPMGVVVPEGALVCTAEQAVNPMLWCVKNGKLVAAAPAPAPPPSQVSMRQARLALLADGKLNAVAAALTQLPSPQREAAQIEWEYASVVDRSAAFVQQLCAALGMSEAEIDRLFIAASQL